MAETIAKYADVLIKFIKEYKIIHYNKDQKLKRYFNQ